MTDDVDEMDLDMYAQGKKIMICERDDKKGKIRARDLQMAVRPWQGSSIRPEVRCEGRGGEGRERHGNTRNRNRGDSSSPRRSKRNQDGDHPSWGCVRDEFFRVDPFD